MTSSLKTCTDDNNNCLPIGQAVIYSLAETSKYPLSLKPRITTLVEKLTFRELKIQPQNNRGAYTGDPLFHQASFRRCPHCYSKNCKRNGKDTKGRIRRLCECGKSFTVNWKVWNLDKLFSTFFEEGFNNYKRKSSIQYRDRIWKRMLNNKKVHEYIDSAIMETDAEKSYSDDEKDRYTFVQACIMADKIDSDEASKHKDSWYFLLNKNDGDVTYILEGYCYRLIRKYNIDLSSRQNLKIPLLHCNKCGMSDISTHGFNNNARRRIKCNNCGKTSVIRGSNLISESEFTLLCTSYLQGFTRDQNLIISMTKKLHHNFIFLSKSKEFDKLMLRQPVITHSLKEEMFKAFIGMEMVRVLKKSYQIILDMIINAYDLSFKEDNEGYLKVPKNKLDILMPKEIYSFLKIEHVKSEEDYKFKNIECEIAAHMHDSDSGCDFYDWKSRSSVVYDQLL